MFNNSYDQDDLNEASEAGLDAGRTSIEDAGCAFGKLGCDGDSCEVHLPSGQLFDLERPDQSLINLRDIASALSRICRWGGRLIQAAEFYSVAQHSAYVEGVAASWGASKSTQLAALWHDAAEAFIGDVCRPIKRRFPEFKALEAPLVTMIYAELGLGQHDYDADLIKRADNAVCRQEARVICLGSRSWNWGDTPEVDIQFVDPEDCRMPREAFEMFWRRHCYLVSRP